MKSPKRLDDLSYRVYKVYEYRMVKDEVGYQIYVITLTLRIL